MRVKILFFSVLQDVTGVPSVDWECDGLVTMGDLLEMVYARWPGLEAWDRSLLLALDHEYVKRDAPLHDGAEVAFMPPVQGG